MCAPARHRPLAPALYAGHQDGFGITEGFDLWLLTASIPGHPEGSSVSTQTLVAVGYRVEWEETL